MTALKIGTKREWGTRDCQYGLTENLCDRPATWHVMWHDDGVSNACDEHLEFIRAKVDKPFRVHPFGEACNIPGVFWFTPDDPTIPGYCYMGSTPSVRTVAAVEAWLEWP